MGNTPSSSVFLCDPSDLLEEVVPHLAKVYKDGIMLCVCVFVGDQLKVFVVAYHCLNGLDTGSTFQVVFSDGESVEATLTFRAVTHDFGILTPTAIPTKQGVSVELDPGFYRGAKSYMSVGLGNNQSWSYNVGVISTELTQKWEIGVSGSGIWGDSGAPCFSLNTKKLIGIILKGQTNEPGFEVRSSPLAWMKPIPVMHLVMSASNVNTNQANVANAPTLGVGQVFLGHNGG